MNHHRRTFIKTAGVAIVGVSVGVSCFSGCSSFTGRSAVPAATPGSFETVNGAVRIDLSNTPSLQNIGGAVKLTVRLSNGEKAKVIVIRPEMNVYKVYEDKCTHRGRELNYKHDSGILRCSSFGKRKFDLAGTHIENPHDESLRKFTVTKEGASLLVRLV